MYDITNAEYDRIVAIAADCLENRDNMVYWDMLDAENDICFCASANRVGGYFYLYAYNDKQNKREKCCVYLGEDYWDTYYLIIKAIMKLYVIVA